MKIKSIAVFVLLFPLMLLANDGEVCLGDSYDKINVLKGSVKIITFETTTVKSKSLSYQQGYRAVTFFNDDKNIYIFDLSNNRLCKIEDITVDKKLLACQVIYQESQCS